MQCATRLAMLTVGLIIVLFAQSTHAAALVDEQSEKVLRAMTEYAQGLKSFRTELSANFKLQSDGTPSKFSFVYSIVGEQPNRLATTAKSGAGAPVVISDGKQLFTLAPMLGKYVLGDAPASFSAIVAAEPLQGTSLGHSIFAGALMPFGSYDELVDTLEEARYVCEEKLGAVKCHHLKLMQKLYDWDIWIDAGNKPMPRKLEPDLTKWRKENVGQLPDDAKLEVAMSFKSWVTNTPLKDKDFKIEPAAGYKQVTSFKSEPAAMAGGPAPLKGSDAPRFSLALLGGGTMNLADHRNKEIVILDFWATWCGPCVAALPQVAEVATAYRGRGVAFYAVNQREEPATIVEFLRDKQLNIPVALDAQGSAAGLYQVRGIPQTVIIGRTGKVEVVHVGFSPTLKQQLAAELEAIIAAQPANAGSAKPVGATK